MESTELIDKLSTYIESSERTRELIVQSILGDSTVNSREITEEEKIKAAYALNMCTVSVSQIVDYKDLNVLEQEYDAILNNLNLEQIPKDDALLQILKQLLDTITYFRIEEGDREMIEKDYQQKMKNAIWSAVPNFGLIVAGGNPVTMAISLASQVGIGYMNYRRNKAEYGTEHEKQMWQLQKTAIEQFNGLRRELFDTAWRLADTYNFPDSYRLTEKQITQYNKILMDQDEVRKYERLDSIKDNFEAYPPFWYFIGNAANYIAGDSSLDLCEEGRIYYRAKAIEYFEKYEKLNAYNILRQDQLVAACALEHIDLLLLESNPDMKKINRLLDKAVSMSGNANDILEMCAITYLKIGVQDKAAKIFRILVNEDYNRVINAQLLSSIYVHDRNRVDYELLASRVDADYLYPMPANDNQNLNKLNEEFGGKQKLVLKQKYRIVLDEYKQKYAIEWNRITSVFDLSVDYPNSFFLDSKRAQSERMTQARRVYADAGKKEYYQRRIADANYELNILCILNEMCEGVFDSEAFADLSLQQDIEYSIKSKIAEKKDDINELQKSMNSGMFGLEGYRYSQMITISDIVGAAFDLLEEYAIKRVDQANVNDITFLESGLRAFCDKHGLENPEIAINRGSSDGEMFSKKSDIFNPELFGHQAVVAKKNAEFMSAMVDFVKEKMRAADIKDGNVAIYFKDTPEFNGYFFNMAFEKYPEVKGHAIMIIKDMTKQKMDLIFTTDGIVNIIKDKVRNITPYNEVKLKSESIVLYKKEYKTVALDVNVLYSLIRDLGNRFIRSVEDKIEYIDGTLNAKVLNQWFKEKEDAMAPNVTRVYAIPTKDMLDHLGYHIEDELDSEHHLLQYYYDTENGDLLGMRIVRFENIESNFQAMLIERNGFMKIK